MKQLLALFLLLASCFATLSKGYTSEVASGDVAESGARLGPTLRPELSRAVLFECLWTPMVRDRYADALLAGNNIDTKLTYSLFRLRAPLESVLRLICIGGADDGLRKHLSFIAAIDQSNGGRVWQPLPAASTRLVNAPAEYIEGVEISFDEVRATRIAVEQSNAFRDAVLHWLRAAHKRDQHVAGEFAVLRGTPGDRWNYVLWLDEKKLIAVPGVVLAKDVSEEVLASSFVLADRWSFADSPVSASKGGIVDLQTAVSNCIIFGDIFRIPDK